MRSAELLAELKKMHTELKGLAARAVVNYIMTEVHEINSISDEELNNVLRNALSLIEIEDNDIHRVKEIIKKMIDA
ncbi:hypothetical protein [Vulcanisaeta sp. JCM 16159]|uniref:hypothetical protein n=1 Tax=Vulcanisaeta sp. JCM 16159 TaxID=1295371 RepID=UPI0006D1C091|nr:hypothetical protein [Vulcanisaeta sp. JCM 16159]